MDERDAPQSASAEEETAIGETLAIFANKVFVSPEPAPGLFRGPAARRSPLPRRAAQPVRTGRRRAWRSSCTTPISPHCAACSTGRQAPPRRRRSASVVRCTEVGLSHGLASSRHRCSPPCGLGFALPGSRDRVHLCHDRPVLGMRHSVETEEALGSRHL